MQAFCGARTRRGTPCKRAPRLNGRCSLHGGKSLAGFAHPQYKHGIYSKYGTAGREERDRKRTEAISREFMRRCSGDATFEEMRAVLRSVHAWHERCRKAGMKRSTKNKEKLDWETAFAL
jgi:hypothetical protein